MEIIGFNTGRRYTANGQRISVGLSSDGQHVLFFDHDRLIYGSIGNDEPMDPSNLNVYKNYFNSEELSWGELHNFAEMVMRRYDAHAYRYHGEADKLNANTGPWPKVRI